MWKTDTQSKPKQSPVRPSSLCARMCYNTHRLNPPNISSAPNGCQRWHLQLESAPAASAQQISKRYDTTEIYRQDLDAIQDLEDKSSRTNRQRHRGRKGRADGFYV